VILSNCCRTKQSFFLENYVVRTPIPNTLLWKIFNMFDSINFVENSSYQTIITWKKMKFYNKVWCLHRRKQTSNTEKTLNSLEKNIMFHEFDTIKHNRNFEKYGVWYFVWKMTVFQKKYDNVLFDTVWYLVRQQL